MKTPSNLVNDISITIPKTSSGVFCCLQHMAMPTFPEPVRMGARTVDGIDNVQGRRLNTVIWILASLSTIFLALRLYAKLYRNRRFWWDDHFLVASYVGLTVSQGELAHPGPPTQSIKLYP
jgi:hypothetical protein